MSTGQTPNRAKFCGDPTRSVQDICHLKFVFPKMWAKIHQNRLGLSPATPIMPNLIEINKPPWSKAVKKFTPSIYWLPRGPLGQRSPVWVVGYINRPLATCKTSSCSDDNCPRYLLPKFVDFVAGVTHKNIKKTMCLRITCFDKNTVLHVV